MHFIQSASSITHQDTFMKKGFSENSFALKNLSALIQPNYKTYIDAGSLRRMSPIIRMSIACSLDCIKQSGIKEPDAIIVGTGLGCIYDTEKFLKDVVSSGDHLISPTPFIQSTHNTIAGQLSLILKNHNYNMTHTQNTLSFEYALQDGSLCLDEGKENVLVGAAEEHIAFLNDIAPKLNYREIDLTSGASFFIISNKKNAHTKVKILASNTYGGVSSKSELVKEFFKENSFDINAIDLILYSTMDKNALKDIGILFKGKVLCDFQKYCGIYFSNSAFALHLGADILERKKFKFDLTENELTNIRRVLIYNNLNSESLGLTLIESLET